MMNRWLGLRLDSIGAFVTFFVVVFVVLRRDDTAAGVLGLVLTYSLAITSDLNWLVRQATDGEAAFNAIEVREREKKVHNMYIYIAYFGGGENFLKASSGYWSS